MKRYGIALAALFAAGCSTSVALPASPLRPAFSEHWYRITGLPDDYAGINLHSTSEGFAGRLVLANGQALPLRNFVLEHGLVFFDVPGLDAQFGGELSFGGPEKGEATSGQWSKIGGGERKTVTLTEVSTAPPEEGKVVTISGGRQIHLICEGRGSPAVILDYGAGGAQKRDWAGLAGLIAESANTQVCTYDRAGRGISDPGALPRDANAVVKDLDEALTAANIAPPYVLVGHSLGSYHVRQFANTHFDKMAGMVLVDPSGDAQMDRFAAVVPTMVEEQKKASAAQAALQCIPKLRVSMVKRSDPLAVKCQSNDLAVIEATTSEIEAMPVLSTNELFASRRSYGAMPLIVLTRGDYDRGMPASMTAEDRSAMKQVWEAMHDEMTALSSAGQRRTIEGAGHYIQRDKPLAVIMAIDDVVAAAHLKAP